MMTAAIWC